MGFGEEEGGAGAGGEGKGVGRGHCDGWGGDCEVGGGVEWGLEKGDGREGWGMGGLYMLGGLGGWI